MVSPGLTAPTAVALVRSHVPASAPRAPSVARLVVASGVRTSHLYPGVTEDGYSMEPRYPCSRRGPLWLSCTLGALSRAKLPIRAADPPGCLVSSAVCCALYCVAVTFDPFGHEVAAPEELHVRLLRLVVVLHVEARHVLVVLRDALVELVVLVLGVVPLDTQPGRLLRVLPLPGLEAALYLQSGFCTTLSGLLPQGGHVRVQGLS